MRNSRLAIGVCCGLAVSAYGQIQFSESEPNDNKTQALANGPIVLGPGDTIVGNTTGATTTGTGGAASADYFLLKTVAQPLGIYRHRLLFSTSGTAGHFTQLRGLSQWDSTINYYPGPSPTGSNTEDATGTFSQTTATAQTPARTITWYGFGRGEQVFDRVTGAAATTGNYTLTYERTQITATDLGSFAGGLMTITTAGQGHTSNTEVWVYDSALRPVPGFNNDDVGITTTPGGGNSTLVRDFVVPGEYYLLVSGQNIANTLATPLDDKQRSVFVYEFPDMVSCSNNTANLNCAFAITDGASATTPVAATRAEPQEILWYRFTVTAPATGACCLPDGSCITASQAGCANAAGTFTAGGACGSVSCAQPPTGACCLTDSTCTSVSSFACTGAGGVWRGAATACGGCPRTLEAFPGTAPGPVANSTAVFFDVTAGPRDLTLSAIDYYTAQGTHSNTAGPEGQLYVFPGGTYQSSTQGPDNATPPAGWSLNTGFTLPVNPGAWTPLHIVLATPVTVPAGQTVGFYLTTRTHGTRVAGFLNPGDPNTFANADLTLFSFHGHNGTAAQYPYWATALTLPRVMIGRAYYTLAPLPCYPNCDGSTGTPALNVNDFICFQSRFAAGEAYADCDQSASLNVNDFVCFQAAFAAGCR